MKIGLIGLPKSGKTTLFNLLTGSSVPTSRYDGGRAELHTGIARVPDARVDRLSALFSPKKTTYATFEVVDLAGIEKGGRASLDTKEFRSADALLHVVRGFPDDGPRVAERFGLGEIAARPQTRVGWVSAVIETEVAQLAGDEQQAFLTDLGLDEPAIHRVLRDCYALLGLVSFFTTGEDEVRA